MTSLRFLADMNLSPKTAADLRQQGLDILRVSQILPRDTEDSEILEFARQQNRVIVTQDLDFSELVALRGYSKPSLITLRLPDSEPDDITRTLLTVMPEIEGALREGCAVTIDRPTVRVRRLPIQ